jgi:hypothetical protein
VLSSLRGKYITREAAAERLGISPRTLDRWWASGRIQATRYTRPSGRRVYDLAEFITAESALMTVERPPVPSETSALLTALEIADRWERRSPGRKGKEHAGNGNGAVGAAPVRRSIGENNVAPSPAPCQGGHDVRFVSVL